MLPLLKILDRYDALSNESIISKLFVSGKYNEKVVEQQIEITLNFLHKLNWIEYNSKNEVQITFLGFNRLANLNETKDKINKLEISESEKKKKRYIAESQFKYGINKSLNKFYKMPKPKEFYTDILKFMYDNYKQPVNKKDMEKAFILKCTNIPKDAMNIVSAEKKILMIYKKVFTAVNDLILVKLIKINENEVILTKKAKKYLKDNISVDKIADEINIKKEIKDKENKNKDSKDLNTTQIYEQLIIQILKKRRKRREYILYEQIHKILLPSSEIDKKTIDIMDQNIKDAINSLKEKNIIKDTYKISIPQYTITDEYLRKEEEDHIQHIKDEFEREKLQIKKDHIEKLEKLKAEKIPEDQIKISNKKISDLQEILQNNKEWTNQIIDSYEKQINTEKEKISQLQEINREKNKQIKKVKNELQKQKENLKDDKAKSKNQEKIIEDYEKKLEEDSEKIKQLKLKLDQTRSKEYEKQIKKKE